jgi:lipopolysaccharide transport system permease protein
MDDILNFSSSNGLLDLASFLLNPWRAILRHHELFLRTILTDIRQRYAGLVIGRLWILLYPLLLMGLYSVIYIMVFRIRPIGLSQSEYVLYIFAGLIPFLGFVEALNAGTVSLSMNKAILLNTVFPAELIPIRAVVASQATTAVGFGMVIVGAVVLGKTSFTLLVAPLVLFFQLMFVAGLVWVLSLGNLVLRDIQQTLSFVSMLLVIISPISYTRDMVPPALQVIIYLNPLSYFVISFQDLIVFGRLSSPGVAAVSVTLGVFSFGIGFWVFQRLKQVFFDYA